MLLRNGSMKLYCGPCSVAQKSPPILYLCSRVLLSLPFGSPGEERGCAVVSLHPRSLFSLPSDSEIQSAFQNSSLYIEGSFPNSAVFPIQGGVIFTLIKGQQKLFCRNFLVPGMSMRIISALSYHCGSNYHCH